jgi:hypothetical protein
LAYRDFAVGQILALLQCECNGACQIRRLRASHPADEELGVISEMLLCPPGQAATDDDVYERQPRSQWEYEPYLIQLWAGCALAVRPTADAQSFEIGWVPHEEAEDIREHVFAAIEDEGPGEDTSFVVSHPSTLAELDKCPSNFVGAHLAFVHGILHGPIVKNFLLVHAWGLPFVAEVLGNERCP